MTPLPPIFLDLAMILITAGVIAVIFKWLKQPLLLGYILAGFFIGPYFPWFPVVTDDANIHVWSDIGVVFLMFAVGLDFSVKKLKKVGATGGITALTELFLMFLIGSSVGRMLGWSAMDCIFLGCMLSISSTAIIIKSFDDLKLKQHKFTGSATAVLVVEDLVAVVLLVVLGTFSVSKTFDGVALGGSILRLIFFLVAWFVFGITIIPTFLKWMRKFMTEETLCIVSVGLCFAMVVFASYVGFSTALGAFVMGAILSETIEVDVIHRIITPLKHLFSAVFFVTVGMLVNPQVLGKYIVPILVISATVIVFKPVSATLGVLLSGKPAKTAVQTGFCFCQIGEFSFIIAGLGLSAGVINPDLYPIIVSVSILTTFATPYMIKWGLPFYEKVYPKLPEKWKVALERYASQSKTTENEVTVKKFLKKQFTTIILFGIILVALLLLSFIYLKPFLNKTFVLENGEPSFWGNLLGVVITIVVMAPFIWAMALKNVNRMKIKQLLSLYDHSQAVVLPVLLLRYFMALLFIGLVVGRYIHLAVGFVLVIVVFVLLFFVFSRKVTGFYQRIEGQFVSNFNQRQAQHSFRIPQSMESRFMMDVMVVTSYSSFVGMKLMDCRFRQEYGVNVVSIERGSKIINMPGKDEIVMPNDRLTVIGSEEQMGIFRGDIEVEPELIVREHHDHEMNIYRYQVQQDGPLCGKDLIRSEFQKRYNGMIIAIERNGDFMTNPAASTVFVSGDVVWFVSPDEITLQKFVKA